MTGPSQPRRIDYTRAARVILAMIDQDVPRANVVLTDAHSDGGTHLLIATLIEMVVAGMRMPAKTDAEVRATLEGMIAAEQLDPGDEEEPDEPDD